ncbi:MAG: hypothetical protein Q7V63_04950 [Gammaproteobacteria bacterium]|nr:hypothetical protein [Gammaproteobacteria bacterium]
MYSISTNDSKNSFCNEFTTLLNAYELKRQTTKASIFNTQRDAQLDIAAKILALCQANKITLNQTKVLIYILTDSIVEKPLGWMFGSSLKRDLSIFINKDFFDKVGIYDEDKSLPEEGRLSRTLSTMQTRIASMPDGLALPYYHALYHFLERVSLVRNTPKDDFTLSDDIISDICAFIKTCALTTITLETLPDIKILHSLPQTSPREVNPVLCFIRDSIKKILTLPASKRASITTTPSRKAMPAYAEKLSVSEAALNEDAINEAITKLTNPLPLSDSTSVMDLIENAYFSLSKHSDETIESFLMLLTIPDLIGFIMAFNELLKYKRYYAESNNEAFSRSLTDLVTRYNENIVAYERDLRQINNFLSPLHFSEGKDTLTCLYELYNKLIKTTLDKRVLILLNHPSAKSSDISPLESLSKHIAASENLRRLLISHIKISIGIIKDKLTPTPPSPSFFALQIPRISPYSTPKKGSMDSSSKFDLSMGTPYSDADADRERLSEMKGHNDSLGSASGGCGADSSSQSTTSADELPLLEEPVFNKSKYEMAPNQWHHLIELTIQSTYARYGGQSKSLKRRQTALNNTREKWKVICAEITILATGPSFTFTLGLFNLELPECHRLIKKGLNSHSTLPTMGSCNTVNKLEAYMTEAMLIPGQKTKSGEKPPVYIFDPKSKILNQNSGDSEKSIGRPVITRSATASPSALSTLMRSLSVRGLSTSEHTRGSSTPEHP